MEVSRRTFGKLLFGAAAIPLFAPLPELAPTSELARKAELHNEFTVSFRAKLPGGEWMFIAETHRRDGSGEYYLNGIRRLVPSGMVSVRYGDPKYPPYVSICSYESDRKYLDGSIAELIAA